MADNNRNRSNYSSDENWDQNRQHDEHSNYGNAGYGGSSYMQNRGRQDYEERGYRHDSAHGRELENRGSSSYNQQQGGYGRVNYMPDNDDNRYQERGYQGGQQSHYGQDYNSGGYNRYGNSGSFGNSNYGNDYRREDWGQSGMNMGHSGGGGFSNQGGTSGYSGGNYGSSNSYENYQNRQHQGYGQENRNREQNWQRTSEQRNVYGGDTSNYGNANQGGWDRDWWDRTKDKVSSWFGGGDDSDRRTREERQYTGGHRGKGPKDYQRSAERIREDICDRLYEDDYVDASNIDIKIEGNEVILSGTVRSKEEKRRAEDLVESISGVRHVENRIRVDRGESGSSMHQYTGNTDRTGGIGDESGTTNEIIRNEGKGRNKNPQ